MEQPPSAVRAATSVNGRAGHLWTARRQAGYRQPRKRLLSRAGEAMDVLWPWGISDYPGIKRGLASTFANRAAWQSIVNWRVGRRGFPDWARVLLSQAIERRIAELQHALAILEKEKGR